PDSTPAAVRFDDEFTGQLRSLPGVVEVGQASAIPASGGGGTIRFVVEGRPTALGQEDECQIMTVSTGYFSSLKIPLVDGRFFTANDIKDAEGIVVVRTGGQPSAFVGAARAALQQMDPQLPLIQPQSLEEVAAQSPSVFLRRYPSYLIGCFATLAVILAVVGLYGLIAHMVLQRTREI